MAITRTLRKGDKQTTWTVDGETLTISVDGKAPGTEKHGHELAAAQQLVDLTRARLKQGWGPTTKPKGVDAFVAALQKAHVRMHDWVYALTDEELSVAYAKAIADDEEVSVEVFRRRPTRELFAFLLGKFDTFSEDDLTKALKFLAKEPDQAAWLLEVLEQALKKGLTHPKAKKFAERNVKKLAAGPKPEPVAPKKAVGNEGALLAAIAAKPDDDGPRLVYADWLLENGLGWGEYLQRSCEYAKLESGAARDELWGKLKALDRKHGKAWLEPIRPFIRSWQFERGLISELTCDPQLFTEAGEAIALRSPRASLRLEGLKKPTVPALAAAPLGAFKEVSLSQQRLDAEQLGLLMASPTVAGVAHWNLSHNPFGDAGLKAIAQSPYVADCTTLNLDGFDPTFTVDGLLALFSSTRLPKLHTLNVGLLGQGLPAALAGCTLRLRSLRLAIGGPVTPADVLAIANAPALAGLEELSLAHTWRGTAPPNTVTEATMAELIERLPKLERLWGLVGEGLYQALPERLQKMLSARAG